MMEKLWRLSPGVGHSALGYREKAIMAQRQVSRQKVISVHLAEPGTRTLPPRQRRHEPCRETYPTW